MRVSELDDLMVRSLVETDHPEIATIERVATSDRPDNHTRLIVHFANGAAGYVVVKAVETAGRRHPDYEIPKGVL